MTPEETSYLAPSRPIRQSWQVHFRAMERGKGKQFQNFPRNESIGQLAICGHLNFEVAVLYPVFANINKPYIINLWGYSETFQANSIRKAVSVLINMQKQLYQPFFVTYLVLTPLVWQVILIANPTTIKAVMIAPMIPSVCRACARRFESFANIVTYRFWKAASHWGIWLSRNVFQDKYRRRNHDGTFWMPTAIKFFAWMHRYLEVITWLQKARPGQNLKKDFSIKMQVWNHWPTFHSRFKTRKMATRSGLQ